MKRIIAFLTCTMLFFTPLSAQASSVMDFTSNILPDRDSELMEVSMQTMSPEAAVKALQDAGLNVELDLVLSLMPNPSSPCTPLDVLIILGSGRFDKEACDFIPVSHVVYAFDCEVFDYEAMYTHFLNGIQMIVPDVEITQIQEDLHNMTDEVDFTTGTNGKRAFSFLCNGNPYALELVSHSDWFDGKAITFIQEVLEKENCPKRLCALNAPAIQGVVLFYADDETIANVQNLPGVLEGETAF